jgi:cell division transport system permease protein
MASLRPRNADDLGLRRALSDRLLPLLVAAMVFLATLALAGEMAARGLAAHWQGGAVSLVTVQVIEPDAPSPSGKPRADAVAAVLASLPGIKSHRLSAGDFASILRPWLGDGASGAALPLPAVFELDLSGGGVPEELGQRLAQAAPGTLVEQNSVWLDRLARLAGSLQACAALALLVVALTAASVIAIATRAGLAARRDSIEIVHSLGATDAVIAQSFAGRVTLLAFSGAVLGLLPAVPLLLGLASLTAPFQPGVIQDAAPYAVLKLLPPLLWALLPALPVGAAIIGWLTAQLTVRRWLARLP